jgi:NADH:ubiquinone oxidoreductase subunit C
VRKACGDSVLLDARKHRGLLTDTNRLEEICRNLQNAGFSRLVDYTAQHVNAETTTADGENAADEFSLFLTLRDTQLQHVALTLKWKWSAEQATHPTLSRIWPAAALAEREIFEMLGIPFKNNDQLEPLLLPETLNEHPLRLDYAPQPPADYACELLKQRHEEALLDLIKDAQPTAADEAPAGGGGA